MAEQKRPTVTVNCSVPNGVQLRRSGPAVFDPGMPEQTVMLRGGQNPGIDKEWFEGWLAENRNLSIVTDGLITAVDEDNEDPANAGKPKSAQRKEATMDHDVMHRDVQGLKKFRAEAEEAIAFYKGIKAAGGVLPTASGDHDPAFEELQKHVDVLAETVTLLQQAHDQQQGGSNDLNDIRARLTALETSKGIAAADTGGDFEQRLAALESSATSDRLTAMLDWFDANQEGLEVLLTLDGEPDTESGTANAGAEDASGAAAEKPATDPAAAPDQASQASPQGDQATGSTG